MARKTSWFKLTAIVILVSLWSVLSYDFWMFLRHDEATVSVVISSYLMYHSHPLLDIGIGVILGGLLVHFLGFTPDWEYLRRLNKR